MKSTTSKNSPDSSELAGPQDKGLSPWQRLKGKRIAYLTLPLLVMATVTEFVILATGWKYQQIACLPQGMGVTFFGIGPIGATILAVELLKLPLAIWTASRTGWTKVFMLWVGLPLICVLTFQLVKDMAVYEMTTAMKPANEMLEKAATEEIKIKQLNGELAAIEAKKADRERKHAELTEKNAKAKTELEEALKRNEATRQDAINLTDYQKKELSEVEARQATIIRQFDADAAQLTKAIADLRARRETEEGRATTWNAEEARIENAYKTKLAAYTNKKKTYEKDKAEYDSANFLKRQLMKEPVDPGVPPEREANKILKPTLVVELDAQIKAKEDELAAVNARRRDSVAQVAADARRLREDFDRRSGTKREETDRKREELLATHTGLAAQLAAEAKQVDEELAVAVKNVDGIRGEIDAGRKKAEGFYEAREASIRNTQVHRIATTVEIVRGLLMGERPLSITATAKERGDVLTDQISMVRIWVYPLLAFIVAFLPTLMVEIGFSTVFEPEKQRPPHRLGFFGRRMHWLYIRAGRLKMLRAERLAREVAAEIAARERALAAKEAELQGAREAVGAAAAEHEAQLKQKEEAWVSKLTAMADSLNRTVVEKDAMRELQRSEVEREIQLRQNAWSDRLTQMRQELDAQRAASEAERTAMMQEQHRKLKEASEEYRAQLLQARRQTEEAEMAAVERSAKLAQDLKEALHARETAESQLKHQTGTFAIQLSQARDEAAHEVEKAARRLKQREQQLQAQQELRLRETQTQAEQELHRQEAEFERQREAQLREADRRLKQELQQQEVAFQAKLKQREEELVLKAEARANELQNQWAADLRARQEEWERQAEARVRAAETRLAREAQLKEEVFQTKLRQREQQLQAQFEARQAETQTQWDQDLRRRDAELAGTKLQEQQLVAKLNAQIEAQKIAEREWQTQLVVTRGTIEPLKALLVRTEKERDEARQAASENAREVENWETKFIEASSVLTKWRNGNGKESGNGKELVGSLSEKNGF